jgi:hypothetical protein
MTLVRYIAPLKDSGVWACADKRHEVLIRRLLQISNYYPGTFIDEEPSSRGPDAGRASRYYRHFVF